MNYIRPGLKQRVRHDLAAEHTHTKHPECYWFNGKSKAGAEDAKLYCVIVIMLEKAVRKLIPLCQYIFVDIL